MVFVEIKLEVKTNGEQIVKCKITEHGVELIPENKFEQECLKHLEKQGEIKMSFEDDWNKSGNLKLEGKPDLWK